MSSIVDLLNSPVLSLFNQALSAAEVLGFASGLWCVWLAARQNILNFPVGIANSALLLLLFAQSRLFADAVLQIVFIVLGVRGWWMWARYKRNIEAPIAIASDKTVRLSIAASIVLSSCIATVLWFVRGSIPVFDGLITGMSLVAQWLLNRKLLQTWHWWIAVDMISIPVYICKDLYFDCVAVRGVFGDLRQGTEELDVRHFAQEWVRRTWRGRQHRMTASFRHGLVIGKFYPPHARHEYLIRTASDCCDFVTVVAMASSVENIPLVKRVDWLTEIFKERHNVTVVGVMDDESINFHSDAIWSAHIAHMQTGVRDANLLRGFRSITKIDAVFTSETYGSELARRFEAAHVCLDKSRALYPISGTAVRKQPTECWEFLAPCVRAYLTQRVVVVGAESTGKTTLAAALTEKLRELGGIWARTQWVPEYGREYSANKLAVTQALAAAHSKAAPRIDGLQWQSEEFEHIAAEQLHREHQAASSGSPVLICDTDAFATEIWHQRYVGFASSAVATLAHSMPPRFGYILTSWQDVEFEQDGLRDGEHIREWMHGVFTNRLNETNTPWLLVTGNIEQRVNKCAQWIDERLTSAWQFTDSLG